ncbi:MAG: hypothetical protein C4333_13350 [Meiothermus sp.]
MAVPGQVLSDPTTRTRLLVRRTARDSGGRALELEVFYPLGAGREANRPHFHRTFEEGFEVLAGAATYVLNGKEHTAQAGEGFRIPRGAAHLNPWNAGPEPLHLRQLIELDPPDRRTLEAFEDFFETLFGLAREGRTGPTTSTSSTAGSSPPPSRPPGATSRTPRTTPLVELGLRPGDAAGVRRRRRRGQALRGRGPRRPALQAADAPREHPRGGHPPATTEAKARRLACANYTRV